MDPSDYLSKPVIKNKMLSRARGRSLSRGRSAKRQRSRSASVPARAAPVARRNRVRAQGTHTFSRYCAAEEVSMNGLFLARMYSVKFEDMLQASDFTSLFDQYMIKKVTYSFQLITNPDATWVLNQSGGQANPSNWFPKMWYIADQDGGTTDTLNSIRERQGVKCRILQPNKTVRISFTPKVRVLTYQIGEVSGYAAKSCKIDLSDVAVPHYGMSCVFDTNGLDPDNTYPFKIAVERKLTFSCYGVR